VISLYDLIIEGATVITAAGSRKMNVAVTGGRFEAFSVPGTQVEARGRVSAEGLWMLPGAVDGHVHFRAPAYSHWETFETGSRAAAAGGITTVIEMPVSTPSVADVETLEMRRSVGERESHVDFGLYAAGAILNRRVTQDLADAGAAAYKIFTIGLPEDRAPDYVGLEVKGNSQLYQAFADVATTGLRVAVHCEDDELAAYFTERLKAAGRVDPSAHSESRPPVVEAASVARIIALAEDTGVRVHIAHISTREAVEMVAGAKERGVDITAETCPHYLMFTARDQERAGPYARMNPPLRHHEDVYTLWDALQTGVVDSVASDHGPFQAADKEKDTIWQVPPGVPGIEMVVPVVLSGAVNGLITPEAATAVLAVNPARAFGLAEQKGDIRLGLDADFILFDPTASRRVDIDSLFTKARECCRLYQGLNLKGQITATYVRGTQVFDGESIVGPAGHGRFVAPAR